jgi:hypothetical protein
VARDFLSFVRRPSDLLKVLRQITVGGVIATSGVSITPTPALAGESTETAKPEALTPTIVDRSLKAAKLLLQLPGTTAYLRAEHRSHRSHSSHRSHFSSSGGGAPAPRPAPAPPPPRPTSPSTLDLTDSTLAYWRSGEVISVDSTARTITIRQNATSTTTFAYRDDSKYETAVGVSIRFDDYADSNRGRVPVVARDKVEFRWRTAPDGKTAILSTIKKAQ